jgi:hypothetical protein
MACHTKEERMLLTTLTVISRRIVPYPSDSTGKLIRGIHLTAALYPDEDVAAVAASLFTMAERLVLGQEQGLKDTRAVGLHLPAHMVVRPAATNRLPATDPVAS